MKGKDVVHSSASDEWSTPQGMFDMLNHRWKFTLDAAASKQNRKVKNYIGKDEDALTVNWYERADGGSIFLNPPFSQNDAFYKKACVEAKKRNADIVILGPARTDTKWFHGTTKYATTIYLIKGRLRFGGSDNSAPFPSAIYVLGSDFLRRGDPRDPVAGCLIKTFIPTNEERGL